jgi:hypothetical protein
MTLFKWLRQADVDEGSPPGVGRGESVELRQARKRIRLLEQENEVLRRAPATWPGRTRHGATGGRATNCRSRECVLPHPQCGRPSDRPGSSRPRTGHRQLGDCSAMLRCSSVGQVPALKMLTRSARLVGLVSGGTVLTNCQGTA